MINGKCINMDWKENIITTNEGIKQLLTETKIIAVLGIKPESRGMQAAFYVPKYMQSVGYKIIPVPVYYPEITEILGEKVYRNMEEIPEQIDMLNVFRRSEDIPQHTEDILKLKPKSVWIQLGIRNDETAEKLAKAGIKVVQDACMLVEHRSLM
jgi:predicted CoA-binding protein